MTMQYTTVAAAAFAIAFTGAAMAASPQEEAARMAHDAYIAAINSNDLDAFLASVTDDIVFIAPNAPAMEGKVEVGAWVGGYFDSVETTWEKTSVEFVVSGDWAYERYAYTVVDTPRGGGASFTDTGNGINIYRRSADGVWLVARDAWATARPLTGGQVEVTLVSCSRDARPC